MSDNLAANKLAFEKLEKPKAVIFDWDNTLINSWPLIHYAIDETMEAMGKEKWGGKKVRETIHKSMRESFPAIFGNKWQEAGKIYKDSYNKVSNSTKLLPGSADLIKALSNANILLFVVSNKFGSNLRKEVQELNLEKYFFSVIGAQDANADKPSRDPVDLALMGSQIDPAKDLVYFIGDTVADIECAYNSSCKPIIFSDQEGQISKTFPEHLVANGREGSGAIPVYFNHNDLIAKLT